VYQSNIDITLLDCTLRDGGYYNSWDYPTSLVNQYLLAMKAAEVNVVELGFRFLGNQGFKGPCAFTTDDYLGSLNIPADISVGVMVNGADLVTDIGWRAALEHLFPEDSQNTPLDLVRLACHFHEVPQALLAAEWLVERGYRVGLNLMQIADRTQSEVMELAELANPLLIEVLYFADSMGSMTPVDTARLVGWLRSAWQGPLGIHTHDNMGLALANTLRAQAEGVSWLDATVTGMGRGPGNARMEELLLEIGHLRGRQGNLIPLMSLLRSHFSPMKSKHGWGTNPYYYLSGKYGIHPTYIQEMLSDDRYDDADILSVIDYLREAGGKKFSFSALNGARQFYAGGPRGTWAPESAMKDREVLILGTGPSVEDHRIAIEGYIRRARPIVLALNTQTALDNKLIDFRIACHPVRLLADAEAHRSLPQPLILPASMMPENVREGLSDKILLDFGIGIERGVFEFYDTHCITPSSLVLAYALAVTTSGKASRILMAGFDGYPAGDLRNEETSEVFKAYQDKVGDPRLLSVTRTRYPIKCVSIYATEV
jgi:4-hydroxy 2-oxovalerate aldolase